LGGKWLLYEESIRTPIIIRGPGIRNKMLGSKLDMMSLNIDIAPTLLELAGIAVPTEMDGMSLLPHLQGKKVPWRKDFWMEHVDVIDVENPIPDSHGVRTEEWKYIRYINVEPEVEELYNVSADPIEGNNLVNDENYIEIKNQLLERYNYYINTLEK